MPNRAVHPRARSIFKVRTKKPNFVLSVAATTIRLSFIIALCVGLALLGGIVRLAQVLRLSAPLLYGALVITVFRPWYLAHTALADGIFLVLVGLAALSWVVTLIRAVRETIW